MHARRWYDDAEGPAGWADGHTDGRGKEGPACSAPTAQCLQRSSHFTVLRRRRAGKNGDLSQWCMASSARLKIALEETRHREPGEPGLLGFPRPGVCICIPSCANALPPAAQEIRMSAVIFQPWEHLFSGQQPMESGSARYVSLCRYR